MGNRPYGNNAPTTTVPARVRPARSAGIRFYSKPVGTGGIVGASIHWNVGIGTPGKAAIAEPLIGRKSPVFGDMNAGAMRFTAFSLRINSGVQSPDTHPSSGPPQGSRQPPSAHPQAERMLSWKCIRRLQRGSCTSRRPTFGTAVPTSGSATSSSDQQSQIKNSPKALALRWLNGLNKSCIHRSKNT